MEAFPDVLTSTLLQAVAERIVETRQPLMDSLSWRLFGVRLRGEHPYEVWGEVVPAWVNSELTAGRAVVVCDIEDYFASIHREQIEVVLDRHTGNEGHAKPRSPRGYADLALDLGGSAGRAWLMETRLGLEPYWGKPAVRNLRGALET